MLSSHTFVGKILRIFIFVPSLLYLCRVIFFKISESAAQRPRLKLLPRSVKEPVNAPASMSRNASIFGTGKPRDAVDDADVLADRSRTTSENSNN